MWYILHKTHVNDDDGIIVVDDDGAVDDDDGIVAADDNDGIVAVDDHQEVFDRRIWCWSTPCVKQRQKVLSNEPKVNQRHWKTHFSIRFKRRATHTVKQR